MDRHGRNDEPVAVLQAAIQELTQGHQSKAAPAVVRQLEVPSFIPAATFRGTRKGYYFGTGEAGTGYYRDEQQALEPEDVAAVASKRHDPQELLRQAEEQAEAAEVQLLDEKSLRKVLNALEKKAKENLELRMKYADDPMKFLDNEVDLMSLIRGLAQVAADPNSLYPMLIDSPVVATLASLLTHENTDIAMEVMDLLQELTDADEEEDNEEVAGLLIDALVEANGLELLVEQMTKLNESADEEAQAVNNALAVIEHALELRPALAESVCERTKLMKWLLSRIRVKASDSNKQYASEILSILVQGHEGNQKLLGAANGIDHLLVCLAGFKNKEPQDAEEQEFMENLFDTLCSCLLLPANRASFVECEGVELMHLLLKGKKSSRYGAIKLLDFATTRSPSACDRLVDAGALAQLFAVFMGRSKIKNSKGTKSDKDVAKEVEERCVSIVSNLFQGVTKDSRKNRLAAKFVENEFEKVDRLMEICFRYEASVRACESRLALEALDAEEDIDEEELLLERMDAGLFTLQCGMVVVAALWSTGDVGLRKRLLSYLHQKGQSLEMVRSYLREFYFSLGDDGAPDEKQRQLQRLGQLLGALGVDIAAEAADREAANEAAAAEDAAEEHAQQQQQPKGTIIFDQQQDVDMEVDDQPPADNQQAAADAIASEPAAAQQQGNGVAVVAEVFEAQRQQQQHDDQPEQQQEDAAVQHKQASSRERHRDRDRVQEGGSEDQGKERERDKEKDRDRSRERDRARDRERDSARDRDRVRARERDRDRDRGRHRERERRRSKSRSRSRSPDGHRRKHRSRERDDDRKHSRHKRSRRSRSRSR